MSTPARSRTGLVALPPFEGAEGQGAWAAVAAGFVDRPFLRSEGVSAPLGVPQRAAPWLVDAATELVTRFNRFYAAVVDAEGTLADDPARRIGEPYERVARIEGRRPALPLSRFDCVLDETGTLRVIELNPIGVCTLHLRGASYLARRLRHMGQMGELRQPALEQTAALVDTLSTQKTASMRRFIEGTLAAAPARPVLGLPLLAGMHRGSKLFWKRELEAAGLDVVFGRPEDLVLDPSGVQLAGKRVDALWADWFIYLGYQQTRYEQTRFASKAGDFSKASAIASAFLANENVARLLADRKLTLLSPLRAYHALSKALLAWIDRPALAISDEDRAYLRAHTAQTFDAAARHDGSSMTLEEAKRRREHLVLKPCRFGGSHGVLVGRDLPASLWAERLQERWADPEWVLQTYFDPVCDAAGARLSFGIYNYDGVMGGLLVRSAPQLVVSARTADLIVAVS